MVALLVFITAALGIFWPKRHCWAKKVHLAITLLDDPLFLNPEAQAVKAWC